MLNALPLLPKMVRGLPKALHLKDAYALHQECVLSIRLPSIAKGACRVWAHAVHEDREISDPYVSQTRSAWSATRMLNFSFHTGFSCALMLVRALLLSPAWRGACALHPALANSQNSHQASFRQCSLTQLSASASLQVQSG